MRGSLFSLPRLQELTRFQHSSPSKKARQQKLPDDFIHNSSSSLVHSPSLSLCCIEGLKGRGRKGQGHQTGGCRGNQNVQEPHSAATFRKKKAQAAFTTHWREPSHFDQDELFSQSALQYLAYLFIICPLAKLFHFWSTWWDSSFLVLILEIREMGGKMLQNREDVSFFSMLSLTLWKSHSE